MFLELSQLNLDYEKLLTTCQGFTLERRLNYYSHLSIFLVKSSAYTSDSMMIFEKAHNRPLQYLHTLDLCTLTLKYFSGKVTKLWIVFEFSAPVTGTV